MNILSGFEMGSFSSVSSPLVSRSLVSCLGATRFVSLSARECALLSTFFFFSAFILSLILFSPSIARADSALAVGVGTTLSSAVDEVRYSKKQQTPESPRVNLELGSIEFKNLSGDAFSSDSVGDKKVVLFFWSLHCRGCVSMLKDLEDIQEESGANDFELLTVHLFEPQESKIREYVSELGVSLPILLAPKSLREIFSVRLLPASLVFDKDRKLIARFDGELTKDDLKLTLTGKLKAEKLTSSK
jgi:thiol-disulfide isomerase/thioredoxin